MMNIIWTNKPSNHDSRRIERVWFERTSVRYTFTGDNHVFSAKLADIQLILSDEAYTAAGRGKGTNDDARSL